MNNCKLTQKVSENGIDDYEELQNKAIDAIQKYQECLTRNRPLSPLRELVYIFLGSGLWTDALDNYAEAAAEMLRALSNPEISNPLIEKIGSYRYDYLTQMLSKVIPFVLSLNAPEIICDLQLATVEIGYYSKEDLPEIRKEYETKLNGVYFRKP